MFVWVKLYGPFKDAAPKGCKKQFAVYANTMRELVSALKQHPALFDALQTQHPEFWVGDKDIKQSSNLTLEQFLNPHTTLTPGSTVHITPHVGGAAIALPAWAIAALISVAISAALAVAQMLLFPPPTTSEAKKNSRTSKLYSGNLNTQKENIPLSYIAGLDVLCGSNIIEASIDYPSSVATYSAKSGYTGSTYGGGGAGSIITPAPFGSFNATTGLDSADSGSYYGSGGSGARFELSHISADKGGSSGGQTIADTIYTDAYVRVLCALGDGPVGGIVGATAQDKAKNIYLNEIQLVDSGTNNFNWPGVTWEERIGSVGQDTVAVTPSITSNVDGGSIQLKHTLVGGGQQYQVVSVTAYDVAKVAIRIRVPQLVQSDKSGNQMATTVSIGVDYKRVSDATWTPAGSGSFSGKTSSGIVLEGFLPAPPLNGTDPWEYRLYRITPDSTDDKLLNDTVFDGHTEYFNLDYKYDGTEGTASGVPVALFGVGFDMAQFSDTNYPEIGVRMVGRKVRVPANYDPIARTYATTGVGTTGGGAWDGSFQTLATQNPVWHWYHLATSGGTSSPVGLGLPDTWFDKFALYKVAQWCDQDVNGRPRYTLNNQFTDTTDGWQFLQDLAKSFAAFCYFTGSQVVLVADQDQATPDHYVNNTMVDTGLFGYYTTEIGDQINEALVEWSDPGDYFRKKVERYRDDSNIAMLRLAGASNGGLVSQTYTKIGCTNRQEAYDFARRLVYTAQHEKEIVSFTTMLSAAAYAPGQIIAVQDITLATDQTCGRVSDTSATTVTLDQPFNQLANTAYDLYCVVGNVLVIRPIAQVTTTTQTSVVTPSDMTGIEAGLPYGIVQHGAGVQPVLYRITDIQDAGDGRYSVTGQFYDRAKYAWIETNVTPPVITYSNVNSAKTVSPPSNLAVTWHAHEDPVRGTIHYLEFSWDKNIDTNVVVRSYNASAKYPDGTVRVLSSDNGTSATIINPPAGPYVFMVQAVNTLGKSSDLATISYTLAYGSHGQVLNPPTLIGLL